VKRGLTGQAHRLRHRWHRSTSTVIFTERGASESQDRAQVDPSFINAV
jgi:hypothetical protein